MMKTNENYVLRRLGDGGIVIPTGAALTDFNGVISLNETGVALWEVLERGCSFEELVDTLCEKFGADPDEAINDADSFLAELMDGGVLL